MAKIKEEDKAPNFTALDGNEEEITLYDYKGSWVVLYFYPKDNTPGCTVEATDFTLLLPKFKKLKAAVIGVSKDNCASHKKFMKDKDLKIILLSDESKEIQKSYGAWGKKKFMGREFDGTLRTTFLIDPNMQVVKVWRSVKAKDHAKEVLSFLTTLILDNKDTV